MMYVMDVIMGFILGLATYNYMKLKNSKKSESETITEDQAKNIFNDLLSVTNNSLSETLAEVRNAVDLSDTVKRLREEKVRLEVSISKNTEDFNRKEREIEHKIGLERSRQKQELELATREAVLKAKEENLVNERDLFKKEMTFNMDRFTKEVEYQRELSEKLLAMLPKMTIKQEIKGE